MKQHVLVVLGIPKDKDGPMPATISPWPSSRKGAIKCQYLSAEQLADMTPDQTAIWEAEYIDGRYWLGTRLPNEAPLDPLRRSPRLVLDDAEVPF